MSKINQICAGILIGAAFLLDGGVRVEKAYSTESLLGIYTHDSKTCGGQGVADDEGLMICDLIYEDELRVAASNGSDKKVLDVTFSFHYGYGDYCRFDGTGTLVGAEIKLMSTEKIAPGACKLSLLVQSGVVRVSDPGGEV